MDIRGAFRPISKTKESRLKSIKRIVKNYRRKVDEENNSPTTSSFFIYNNQLILITGIRKELDEQATTKTARNQHIGTLDHIIRLIR